MTDYEDEIEVGSLTQWEEQLLADEGEELLDENDEPLPSTRDPLTFRMGTQHPHSWTEDPQ